MRRTLNPDFLTDPFELNLTVIVLFLDFREEKELGTEEPQSQTFGIDLEFPSCSCFFLFFNCVYLSIRLDRAHEEVVLGLAS